MEEDERKRIEAEATRRENVDQRLKTLEGKAGLLQWVLLGAIATLVSNIWDKIQGVIK